MSPLFLSCCLRLHRSHARFTPTHRRYCYFGHRAISTLLSCWRSRASLVFRILNRVASIFLPLSCLRFFCRRLQSHSKSFIASYPLIFSSSEAHQACCGMASRRKTCVRVGREGTLPFLSSSSRPSFSHHPTMFFFFSFSHYYSFPNPFSFENSPPNRQISAHRNRRSTRFVRARSSSPSFFLFLHHLLFSSLLLFGPSFSSGQRIPFHPTQLKRSPHQLSFQLNDLELELLCSALVPHLSSPSSSLPSLSFPSFAPRKHPLAPLGSSAWTPLRSCPPSRP